MKNKKIYHNRPFILLLFICVLGGFCGCATVGVKRMDLSRSDIKGATIYAGLCIKTKRFSEADKICLQLLANVPAADKSPIYRLQCLSLSGQQKYSKAREAALRAFDSGGKLSDGLDAELLSLATRNLATELEQQAHAAYNNRNLKDASKLYLEAAKLGNSSCLLRLAMMQINNRDLQDAVKTVVLYKQTYDYQNSPKLKKAADRLEAVINGSSKVNYQPGMSSQPVRKVSTITLKRESELADKFLDSINN